MRKKKKEKNNELYEDNTRRRKIGEIKRKIIMIKMNK